MKLRAHILASLIVVTLSDVSYSQTKEIHDKNSFSFNTTFYNFLNGEPTFQTKYLNQSLTIFNSFGVNFSRKINNKNLWGLQSDYHAFVNRTPLDEMLKGTYSERHFLDVRGNYSRQLVGKSGSRLFSGFGLSLRLGEEVIFGNYFLSGNFGETFVRAKTLFDLGLSTGLKYNYHIGQNFHLYAKLSYTFYLLTLDSKDENYEWDRGPTRHMLALSIGFGFNYGEE